MFNISITNFKICEIQEIYDFDLLKQRNSYCITIFKHNDDINCSCREFLKHYACKHSIAIKIKLGFVNPPFEAQQLPLESNRTSGRPPHNSAPLSFD